MKSLKVLIPEDPQLRAILLEVEVTEAKQNFENAVQASKTFRLAVENQERHLSLQSHSAKSALGTLLKGSLL
jgi:hypothetical protein